MITSKIYGMLGNGRKINQYILANNNGMTVWIIEYGAIITNMYVPGRDGKSQDIVLGYESLSDYVDDRTFMGGIVGRYGNRISRGEFVIDETKYRVTVNNGVNHLHGGNIGFHQVKWQTVETGSDSGNDWIVLDYISQDGEEGYPGTLNLKVKYVLTDKNELIIKYYGSTDKPTIVNPTHHSYFNLSGNFGSTILNHELKINADYYLPVDECQIPLSMPESVVGTPMDFRESVKIGEGLKVKHPQLNIGNGYDHNWNLNGWNNTLRCAAELHDPATGRVMDVLTDQPGLQFYSGNSLSGLRPGKGGKVSGIRTGLCLEAQMFPDSPNRKDFPSCVIRPNQQYRQETVYKFSIR